jgi:hypothetical protein
VIGVDTNHHDFSEATMKLYITIIRLLRSKKGQETLIL